MLLFKAIAGLLLGLLCLLTAPAAINGERASYVNYRLYKLTPSTATQLSLLQQLDGASDSIIFIDGVNAVNKEISVVVAPHKVPDFLEIMGMNEISYTMASDNLQSLLDDDKEVKVASGGRATYSWDAYYELDTTYQWLQSLSQSYPQAVTLIEGGKSYQGRSILGVRISYNRGGPQKPGIFLEAGIHAREWIAPATATYIINQLLTSQDAAIRSVAESYDWYIFPHANPDGYVYTHTTDRMWRKTRTPYGICFGADPNRNWGFHWNEVGASSLACADTYAGPSAFSELETRSLSNYIASLTGKIQLYISFHAYSQYLLYPFGATNELPSNIEDYKRVFNVATAAINKRYSTTYTGGNIYDAIYPAAGSSVDWAYDKVGTKMAFCYELRPSSTQSLIGFRLPAEQIIPTGEETLDSILAMVDEVQELGYFNA